ncbi:tetratricopeptide repeat protein [Bacteroidales bacterium AH-315-I05]|nr:tetratricopeptide repeat protein [Bacteroidales bacterium AH-315-I05]
MSRKKHKNKFDQPKTEIKEALISKREKLVHCIFLFVLGFAIYANTLNHGYVLDDSLAITGNEFTKQGIAGISDLWTTDFFVGAHGKKFDLTGGRYRPLSLTMFAMEYELFGLNPFVGHLLNVILYALCGVLIYLLLIRLLPNINSFISLITAVLFITHPIHTEVVANIKSLDEILAVLFLAASLIFMLKNNLKMMLIGCVFFMLSLLSKEVTITALAILPLTLLLFTDDNKKSIAVKSLLYVATGVAFVILRTAAVGWFGGKHVAANLMDNPYLGLSFFEALPTKLLVAGQYLKLLFWPHPLSFDYSYNAISLTDWGDWRTILSLFAYLGIAALAIIIIYKFFKIRTQKSPLEIQNLLIAYGILFYLFAFSIVSNFVFNIGTIMGERFVYLASLGFCIAIAALLAKVFKINLQQPLNYKSGWVVLMAIVISVSSYATIKRNPDWKYNYTLYKADVNKVPNSARTRMFYGIELLGRFNKTNDKSKLDEAIFQLETACKIFPEFYHAYYNLALAYQRNNEFEKAFKCHQEVLKIQPQHLNATFYIGKLHGFIYKDFDKATEMIETAISYGFNDKNDAYLSLGSSYAMKGDLQKALNAYKKGLEFSPSNHNFHTNIGRIYAELGEQELAKKYYDLAANLKQQQN